MRAPLWRSIPAMLLVLLLACGQGAAGSGGARSESAPAATTAPASSASGAPASSAPPAPATLRYGQVTLSAMFWPLYVADSKGLFRDENLTVETTVFRV